VEPNGPQFGLLSTATEEDFMRIRLLVAAAGLVALTTPSLAADYYNVQDTSTKRCSIVEQRPTTQTTTIVGGKAYTTRSEAEGAMKTVKVCESGGTVGGPVPPPPPGR
jgi:glycerol-3-phosphate dehydrogenase